MKSESGLKTQSRTVEKIRVSRELPAYEPGFGAQLKESLQTGWKLVEMFFLLLVRGWIIWLILLIVWLLIKRRRKEIQ